MKLSNELTRNQIENDLKHYYNETEFIHKSNNDLLLFFTEHVKKHLEEVRIDTLFTENNINKTYLIDTPDGIQQIGEKIKKSKRECYTIKTVDNKSISCSYDHKLETPEGWKFAKNILKKDYILTIDGFKKIKSIYKIKDQEVFDFEILHPNHRYWGGNGISSHNTGKTYLSLMMALHLLKTEPQFKQVVLIKSVQTIPGEDLGFLPGTLMEKMEPYMSSFTGNLNKITGNRLISQKLMESGVIRIEPIAFVRGNTIDNSIVIIDETQNINIHTFKTIITRIGRNSKMIFLGDIEQVDRKGKDSCLADAYKGFENSDFVGTIEFVNEECVRNPIIPKVLNILNSIE